MAEQIHSKSSGPRTYIADLAEGAAVDEVFFIRESSLRSTRAGQAYLALKLGDRTGTIEGRLWDVAPEQAERLRVSGFARFRGRMEGFRDRPQLRIASAEPVSAAGIDRRHFLPSSFRDPDELAGYLDYFLTEVFDPDHSRLLASFFGDVGFMERFREAPGDARSHHAYLGGLIEHTVSVATLCQHVTVQHPRLDADLLITAALLHDIGKVDEFSLGGQIGYSREGRLLGHVLIGQRMIEDRMRDLKDYPREKGLDLLHAVISHHGELEWGAPRRPQSAEALVLHHIDNLDAKVKGFLEVVEGRGELPWPQLQNYFRRPLSEPRAADRE